LKYGRVGKPHFRIFRLTEDKSKLQWFSSKKTQDQSEIAVAQMQRLCEGQSSEVFAKNRMIAAEVIPEHFSFSIYYSSKDNRSERTLDLVCKDKEEYTLWVQGIKWLIAHKYDGALDGEQIQRQESMLPPPMGTIAGSSPARNQTDSNLSGAGYPDHRGRNFLIL
jgi:hypothetical protein